MRKIQLEIGYWFKTHPKIYIIIGTILLLYAIISVFFMPIIHPICGSILFILYWYVRTNEDADFNVEKRIKQKKQNLK